MGTANNSRVRLGSSSLEVSPVGFGCWPIAGVSSLGVTFEESVKTVRAALESGINFFDTAYSYGYDGEADQVLAEVLQQWSGEVVIASKVGMYFDENRERVFDGRPSTIFKHAEEILARLSIDVLDVLYLHVPDPQVPIEESAGAIGDLISRGCVRYAGVSNVDASQLAAFHAVTPVVVAQPPFNMLQHEMADQIRPLCEQQQIGIAAYWVLMKGLLAGKLSRDHQFDPADKRLTYEVFQGQPWQRAQDLLDTLRDIASLHHCTVSQLVIAWTLAQPQITVALCGAKRDAQIIETARAMQIVLSHETLQQIDDAIALAQEA